MDGGNGVTVLYNASPLGASGLDLAVDEDQIKDSERAHTSEQVAYLVFAEALVYPAVAQPDEIGGSSTRAIIYEYDPLNRLIGATYSTGEHYGYTYDAVGNRIALTDPSGVSSYVYDAAQRLTSVDGVAYTYDDRGNQTGNGTFTYEYDGAGRMVAVQGDGKSLSYFYDGDGLRVVQSENGSKTVYAWDVAAGLPQMLSDSDNLYLVGHNTLGYWDSNEWIYYLPDALGSMRQETDATGTVTNKREWTPFGGKVGIGQSGLGYTGEWFDSYINHLYLRARWYEPGLGRFLSRDPVRRNHPYQYARANPVNLTDPSGRDPITGGKIHIMIQDHYLANYAQGRLVIPEYAIPGASKKGTGYQGYADIADLTLRQLYEIKPIAGETSGQSELTWYLSFLPGWIPGAIYSPTPVRIGPWPNDPTRDVYAQMRIPGVIAYWGRSRHPNLTPVPIPIPERDPEKYRSRYMQPNLQPALAACGVVFVVGATVIILFDPVPGDELLLPVLWGPVLAQ